MGAHGVYTSPDSPGDSPLMQWIAEHRDHCGSNHCLIWPYGHNSAGYPTFGRRGKMVYVHRYMCEYRYGSAPKGCQAAHSCGNTKCCNPMHLSWKTPSANQYDRIGHGRPFTGRRHTLNAWQILQIRCSSKRPAALAKIFGVTEANIRHIRSGRTNNSRHPSA